MGRMACSAFSGRVLWVVALVALVGTLAIMSMATTAGAAAAESGGCCCPCGRGASVKGSADFVEMGDAGRTKAGSKTATVDNDLARTKRDPTTMGATFDTGGARKAAEATSYTVSVGYFAFEEGGGCHGAAHTRAGERGAEELPVGPHPPRWIGSCADHIEPV